MSSFIFMQLKVVLSIGLLLYVANAKADSCYDRAETQHEMHVCASKEASLLDKELNRIYQKIRTKYNNDKVFLNQLKEAQRAWIKSRDEDLRLRYPHQDEPNYYGSVYPMCLNQAYSERTKARIAFLSQWLEASEEGDVCRGSLP